MQCSISIEGKMAWVKNRSCSAIAELTTASLLLLALCWWRIEAV